MTNDSPRPILKWLLYLMILGALGALAYWKFAAAPQENQTEAPSQTKLVEVKTIRRQTIEEKIPLFGTLESAQTCVLQTKDTGTLEILIPSLQWVKAGDGVARIHRKDREKSYEILKEAERIAQERWERAKSLEGSGIVTKHTVEDRHKSLLEIQKELSDIQMELWNLHIEAPFDGQLGIYTVPQNAEVHPGEGVVAIYNPKALRIQVDLPEHIALQVQKDTLVEVKSQRYPLTEWEIALDPETLMCRAYIAVPEGIGIIGSTLPIEIILQSKPDAIVIPREALFVKQGKLSVYILEEGEAGVRPVTLGILGKDVVEVTEGLEEGDALIFKGHHRLYPGIQVEAVQERSAS
jgi:membrane fusion protein (multidrug efflux system)